MAELFGFFWSPHGIVLFVVLWIIKAAFGVWLAVQAIGFLPQRMQERPMSWLKALTPKASHGALLGKKNTAQDAQDDVTGGPVQ